MLCVLEYMYRILCEAMLKSPRQLRVLCFREPLLPTGWSWLSTARGRSYLPRCYYGMLGVSNDALRHEIKSGYLRAAMKVHPDRNDSAEAKEQFQALSHAYAILRDPALRRVYDRDGPELSSAAADAGSSSSGSGSRGSSSGGNRAAYQTWKDEVLKSVWEATFRAAGIHNVDDYLWAAPSVPISFTHCAHMLCVAPQLTDEV